MLHGSGMANCTGFTGAPPGIGVENRSPFFDVQHAGFPQHPADDPDTRFFIIRSSTDYNVEVSKQRGIWATIPRNEARLAQAVQEAKYVILFFRVQSSECWSGYALMRNAPGQGSCPSTVFAGRSGRPFVGRTFDVEWIRKKPLSVEKTRGLLNRFNNGESVNRAMDGQPVDPEAGRALVRMFDEAALGSDAATAYSSYGPPVGHLGPLQAQPMASVPPVQVQQQRMRQRAPQPQQRQPQDTASQQHVQQQALQTPGTQRKKQVGRKQFDSEDRSTGSQVGSEEVQSRAPNNPAMRIFPIDLTGMTYDDYIETYEASQALWQRVFKKHGYTVDDDSDQNVQSVDTADAAEPPEASSLPKGCDTTATEGANLSAQQTASSESERSQGNSMQVDSTPAPQTQPGDRELFSVQVKGEPDI